MSFFQELKRRNVFRTSAAYAVVGWLLTEIAAMAFGTFEAPAWVMKVFVTFIILGFPLAVFFAWAFELTPDGLKRARDGWSEHNHLAMIAYAYQRMGNEELFQDAMLRFGEALEYQRQIGANNQNFAFAEAVHAVLAGDHETALLRLARAIEGGVTFDPNLTDAWPMFAVLEDNPRFQATVKRMTDHMNSERAKLGLGSVSRQPALGPHGI